MADESSVVEFPDWRDTVALKRRDILRECKHLRVSVAEKEWEVTCRDCGKLVDPVRFIRQLAQKAELFRAKERAAEKIDPLIERLISAGGRVVIDKNGVRAELTVDGKRHRRSGSLGRGVLERMIYAVEYCSLELQRVGARNR